MPKAAGTVKAFRPSLYGEAEEGVQCPVIDEVRLANIALYEKMASEGQRLFEKNRARRLANTTGPALSFLGQCMDADDPNSHGPRGALPPVRKPQDATGLWPINVTRSVGPQRGTPASGANPVEPPLVPSDSVSGTPAQ